MASRFVEPNVIDNNFRYNYKIYHPLDVHIQGDGVDCIYERIDTWEALKICREFFAQGIETKAFALPSRNLIIEYSKPFEIEKTYNCKPLGKLG